MISVEHRRDIEAAIPTGVKVPDAFWSDLTDALDVFVAMDRNRNRRPPWRELKKWKRAEEYAAALIAELRGVDGPSWVGAALKMLEDLRERAGRAIIGYEFIATGYRGRAAPHRMVLFETICDLWVRHLKQELGYSMPPTGGEPYGPAIRFFEACLAPALGVVSPHAVRGAIDRAKDRAGKSGRDRLIHFKIKK
jgi:hypothetical protein